MRNAVRKFVSDFENRAKRALAQVRESACERKTSHFHRFAGCVRTKQGGGRTQIKFVFTLHTPDRKIGRAHTRGKCGTSSTLDNAIQDYTLYTPDRTLIGHIQEVNAENQVYSTTKSTFAPCICPTENWSGIYKG